MNQQQQQSLQHASDSFPAQERQRAQLLMPSNYAHNFAHGSLQIGVQNNNPPNASCAHFTAGNAAATVSCSGPTAGHCSIGSQEKFDAEYFASNQMSLMRAESATSQTLTNVQSGAPVASFQQQQSELTNEKASSRNESQIGTNLPFSLENCFLMDQTRLLIKMADGTSHEVDSIVECRGPQHQSREQQFKLEMCCSCCSGRRIMLNSTKLLQIANEPLRDLAMQTIQMHSEGLEITYQASGAPGCSIQDDFDMDGDDEPDSSSLASPLLITTHKTIYDQQQQQQTCQFQPRMQPSLIAHTLPDANHHLFYAGQGSTSNHQQQAVNSSLLRLSNCQPSPDEQLIDTRSSDQQQMRLLKRTSSSAINNPFQMSANNFSQADQHQQNLHELKDHDYDDEEFHMSEASEEGTAVDYDSQAENPQQTFTIDTGMQKPDCSSSTQQQLGGGLRVGLHQQVSCNGGSLSSQRPGLNEFEDLISGSKRRRFADQSSSFGAASAVSSSSRPAPMMRHQLVRNFSSHLDAIVSSPEFEKSNQNGGATTTSSFKQDSSVGFQ